MTKQTCNFIKAAIAPLHVFDVDEALMRYSLNDVRLAQYFEFLKMVSGFETSTPAPQSYPIENLPGSLGKVKLS